MRPFRLVRGNKMILMYIFFFTATHSMEKQRRRGPKHTQKKKKKKKKKKAPPPPQPTSNTTGDHGRKSTPNNPNFGAQIWLRFRFSNQFLRHGLMHFVYKQPTKKQNKSTKRGVVLGCLGFSFVVLCVCALG